MSNQEAFEKLSELEEFFLYKKRNPDDGMPPVILYQLHYEIKTALIQWRNISGCKLS